MVFWGKHCSDKYRQAVWASPSQHNPFRRTTYCRQRMRSPRCSLPRILRPALFPNLVRVCLYETAVPIISPGSCRCEDPRLLVHAPVVSMRSDGGGRVSEWREGTCVRAMDEAAQRGGVCLLWTMVGERASAAGGRAYQCRALDTTGVGCATGARVWVLRGSEGFGLTGGW